MLRLLQKTIRPGSRYFSNNSLLTTAGRIIQSKLEEHGVDDIFIYSGGAIMPVLDEFYNPKYDSNFNENNTKYSKDRVGKIKYYVSTNEQSLGYSATGYAKSSGKPGVCIVTSGPGPTNLVTAMLDATNDSTPLVVFSGQVPLDAMGTNAFQEGPTYGISKPVTKWNYVVKDPNELEDVIDHAFKVAMDGKKGAVLVDLPKCVTTSIVNLSEQKLIPEKDKYKGFVNDSKTLEKRRIRKIAKVINKAKRPVLYIGQGAKCATEELRQMMNDFNIPATTTIHAMGIINENDNLSLEMLGMHGSAYANYAIQDADCIISVGTRFDDRTTGLLSEFAPNAYKAYKNGRGGIIHCNINPNEISNVVKPHYWLNCDSKLFIENLLPHLRPKKKRKNWIKKIQNWKNKYPFTYEKAKPSTNGKNPIKTQSVIIELNKQLNEQNLKDKTIFTTGVGNHQMMTSQFIKWTKPNSMITSGSLGVMGVGLPYALGAQIANPDSLVINIDGDSSFNQTFTELITLARYNLPVKVIICNDSRQSMVDAWGDWYFENRQVGTDCPANPDYNELANVFGIKGYICDNYDELPKTINKLLNTPGPAVANFITLGDKCLPCVLPKKALHEMILPGDSAKNTEIDLSSPPS